MVNAAELCDLFYQALNENGELWKPVKVSNERYFISNIGRVYGVECGRMLSQQRLPNGYMRVHLSLTRGKKTDAYVHRLVAEAFCEHPEGCDVVNHKDNDQTNNRAENLEWTTQHDNVFYAMLQGRMKGFPMVRAVKCEKDGVVTYFQSTHDAERITGCCHKSINKSWRTGKRLKSGYKWEVIPHGLRECVV